MAEVVALGQKAPDFTLKSEANQDVTLSRLQGKPVVLVFYALDWSPVCHGEMCSYRDDSSEFQAAGVTVLGISRDSVWSHKAWKDNLGLTHSLLADMKGTVARAYGCWNEDMGLSERLTIVIDKDGIIRNIDRSPNLRIARDHKKTLAALKALR